MSGLECPSCGVRLLASATLAGAEAGCPRCGAAVAVPAFSIPVSEPAAVDVPAEEPPDPSPAAGGDVAPPRPTGGSLDAQLPLILAVSSLFVPILAPIAMWLVHRTAQSLEGLPAGEPQTLRTARYVSYVGLVLLGVVGVCFVLTVLSVG